MTFAMKTSLKNWFAKQILSTTSRHRSEFQLIIERPTETIINNIMDTEIVLANACQLQEAPAIDYLDLGGVRQE